MSARKIFSMTVMIVLSFVLTHLGWSLFLTVLTKATYDHRAPNVRNLKNATKDWSPMLGAFIGSTANGNDPTILFVGSSFTFGYSFDDGVVFSRYVQNKFHKMDVLNISVIGRKTSDYIDIFPCSIVGSKIDVDTIIVEVPVLNDSGVIREILGGNTLHTENVCKTDDQSGLLKFFIHRPYGISWINLLL